MISTRAEAREAKDRLRLLGMTEDAIARLDRDQTIRSYVPIEAPFEGRVIARNLTKGEVVETTEKLFVVADLSEVWVLANIPEKDIPYVYTGTQPVKSAEIRVTAYPEEVFQGRVTYVGDVLDPQTRTMRMRLEVPNLHRKLKPAMYATVRISSKPEANVLMVPEAAVQRDRDRRFVFVQKDASSFEARSVKLGDSNGEAIKVLEGLQDGEVIVTHGAFVLKSELFGEQT
jgi:cobalt-zinc-cadmium efflux system membrane fusion protein